MNMVFTELSQAVSLSFPDKYHRVVSLPKGMQITDRGSTVTEKVPTIAVVDGFSSFGSVKIAPGMKVPHGRLTTKYAVSGLEDKVGVLALDITPPQSRLILKNRWAQKKFSHALEALVDIQKKHHNIIALNLSLGTSLSYDTLTHAFRFEISPATIQAKKVRRQLKEMLGTKKSGIYRSAHRAIQAIDQLVDMGVTVYKSAGNNSDEFFDLLTLSRAQYIVSAPDFAKSNKLRSNAQEQGVHTFTKVCDRRGKLLRITDGRIGFGPEEIQMKPRIIRFFLSILAEDEHQIAGTSYAAPIKLNKDLKASFERKA